MEINKTYNPEGVEDKWYAEWMKHQCFHSTPDERESYTVVIPPPNVTGVLHMGHMLNNTIQDVLVRKARMEGKNACWVPGTDHASIATEAKVVQKLRNEGIKKSDLSREEFLKHAWLWKEKHGGIILEQLKKLGASVDWNRVHFTMDEAYYKAVEKVFVDLYNKGYIYRGKRMVNWDCEALTTISNEEVIYNENGEKSTLYHIKYQIENSDQFITIATQRPETIMGDTAIAVNPNDERFQHLIGKKAIVPLVNRPVTIIADDYVEKDFGTGALKITPAHDPNDYEIGLRHNLEIIDTINDDGTMNELCGVPELIGKDRFIARKMVIKMLKEQGILVGEEEFITKIGRSERTNSVVEPRLSLQWFIKMKDISTQALKAVETDEIKIYPSKFKNIYRHWMTNVKDWCISRQLWWGHRIPAYYYGDAENDFVVALNPEEALEAARQKSGNTNLQANQLRQDEDVLDTWASSWIWPIEVFKGFDDTCFDAKTGKINLSKNKELNYYYPTKVLVTAPEILFFWVARMIIAGYEYTGKKPFDTVYLHGIVRDKQGRKMSKSLGNSPDPLDLIKKYGADGTRVGMLLCSPAGNDLLFDEALCEQGRNFNNKIWNSYRLTSGWSVDANNATTVEQNLALEWMENRFNKEFENIQNLFSQYRLSEALMAAYKLYWDDYCSWFLEIVKPTNNTISPEFEKRNKALLDKLLRLLHPFVPFITEEIWHLMETRKEGEFLTLSPLIGGANSDESVLSAFEKVRTIITEVRAIRNCKNISPKEELELNFKGELDVDLEKYVSIIVKLAKLSAFTQINESKPGSVSFVSNGTEFFVPLAGKFDVEAERKKIEAEIEYAKGFINSIMKKLGNERFIQNAKPEVVEAERKKKADAEAKIAALENQLNSL